MMYFKLSNKQLMSQCSTSDLLGYSEAYLCPVLYESMIGMKEPQKFSRITSIVS